MGRTNRFLSKISTKIAITYKNTIFAHKSAILSGIPIRKLKVKKNKKNNNKKTILIIGGSQGAQVFSEIIKKVLLGFDNNLLKKIFIVHQVRKEDLKSMKNFYQNLNIKFKIKSFFTNIYDEINNSDLIISRCGASTLAEIEFFKKFCILIPLPTSANNHQFYNAVEFKRTNNCEIINQSNINNDKLVKIIKFNLFKKKIKKIQQQRKTKKVSLVNIINDMLK